MLSTTKFNSSFLLPHKVDNNNPLITDTVTIPHFVVMNTEYIHNIQPVDPPILVFYPSGKGLISTHIVYLRLPFPPDTKRGYIFKHLTSGSLLSIY